MSEVEERVALLTAQMERAAASEDFETAARLRNEIEALSGGSPLVRPIPRDQMGMGSSSPVIERRKNWRPPKRPDPMTQNVKKGHGKR